MKDAVQHFKALEQVEGRAYQIARTFYRTFTSLGWVTTEGLTQEVLDANSWILSALWFAPGESRDNLTLLMIVKELKKSIRIRARERTDAWKYYEAHLEEFAALEVTARMLDEDVHRF